MILSARQGGSLLAVQALKSRTAAPVELRVYLAEQSKTFLADPNAEDLLAAHLNNAQDPAATITAVRAVIRDLSAG